MRDSDGRLAFEKAEFAIRLSRVQRELVGQDIAVLLVDVPENITYLTGLETAGYYMYTCAIVPAEGEIQLLLRCAEAANAKATSWIEEPVLYEDTDDPLRLVAAIAKDLADTGRIAVEMNSSFLTVNRYRRLVDQLEPTEIVDGSEIIAKQRCVKSQAEIAKMRAAAQISSEAMKAAVGAIEPGRDENEIAGIIFETLIDRGSGFLGMEPFINTGPRTGTVHASWSGRKIRTGEPILIEIGASVNRYHAALMRTIFVGSVPQELEDWATVTQEALDAAIESIQPGITAGEVDEACRGTIERAGLFERFRKRTGYSVGLAYAPDWGEGHLLSLQRDDPTVLVPGMTFHIPPALREQGKYGFGISETVLVTETGCQILTTLPDRMIRK